MQKIKFSDRGRCCADGVVNPDKSKKVTFTANDRIIVNAES